MSECTNLIVVSDLHCGCRMGLCPPEGAQLDDGGTYLPSAIQQKIWSWWKEFWSVWVPRVTKKESFIVVVNGDAIDGVHHQSTTQISHNLSDQGEIAYNVLAPIAAKAKAIYMTRGTEVHEGQSGVESERLAKRLGAIPNEQKQHSRYELWIRVGDALVHLMHHIGTTSSSAHEASAVNAELSAEYTEAARWGEDPPDFVVRSHRHRFVSVNMGCKAGRGASMVTPGWQAKTPFSYRIAGARLAPPQFGGLLIRQGDEEPFYREQVWHLSRSKEETA